MTQPIVQDQEIGVDGAEPIGVTAYHFLGARVMGSGKFPLGGGEVWRQLVVEHMDSARGVRPGASSLRSGWRVDWRWWHRTAAIGEEQGQKGVWQDWRFLLEPDAAVSKRILTETSPCQDEQSNQYGR